MYEEKENLIRKTVVVIDAIIISFSFFISYIIRENLPNIIRSDATSSFKIVSLSPGSINDYVVVFFICLLIWLIALYSNHMYNSLRTQPLKKVLWIVFKSALITAVGFGTLVFMLKLKFVSRLFFINFLVIGSLLLSLEKIALLSILHSIRRKGSNMKRFLIVGTGRRAASFIKTIQGHQEFGINIVGIIDDEPDRGIQRLGNIDVIGNIDDLEEILYRSAIDEVVFVVPRRRLNHIQDAIGVCETKGIRATIAADLFDLKIAKCRTTELDSIPLISFEVSTVKEWQLWLKRIFDIIISSVSIVVLSPVLMITFILIKATSPGPAIFKQERMSLNGRRFILYKFRTMYNHSEKRKKELDGLNNLEGPIFKMKNDPRITPVGKVLRKLSIDELPQLINVLMGQMSIVGPRALPVYELNNFEPWQRRRLSVRAGLTGLWQVNGRNNGNFEHFMELDLEYVDNWSLWMDFRIMAKTIPVVLRGIGAY